MQNVLEYTGSKHDRQIIRKHEFYYEGRSHKTLKFDVLLVRSGTLHDKDSLHCLPSPVTSDSSPVLSCD